MSYLTRKALFEQFERIRERPLISYVTSIRPNLNGIMAGDSIKHIIEQVRGIPNDQKEIDFLIISNGGDPITSLRIISILRERFDKISVVVPYVAYSAATILALGADEIIMHPYSNLGPVDPQLAVSRQSDSGQASKIEFSSEDIRNYIEFVKSDVGITDQTHLITAFSSLAKEVGPIPIGSAKRSQQLSLSLSIKMLETHMEDKNKAATIAKALNTSYYHHGYAVGRTEAKKIGLNVIYPEENIEELMWKIWEDYSDEMNCGSEFNLVATIMNNPTVAEKINKTSIVNIPANIPPQVAQNIIATIAQQNTTIIQQEPIEFSELMVTIESLRTAMAAHTTFNVICWRDTNMAIVINATAFPKGWQPIKEKLQ